MEYDPAVGTFCRAYHASASHDTESNGGGVVVPGSMVSSPAGDTEVAGGHQGLPDLSLEGPFDVRQSFTASAGWDAGLPVPHDVGPA